MFLALSYEVELARHFVLFNSSLSAVISLSTLFSSMSPFTQSIQILYRPLLVYFHVLLIYFYSLRSNIFTIFFIIYFEIIFCYVFDSWQQKVKDYDSQLQSIYSSKQPIRHACHDMCSIAEFIATYNLQNSLI